MSLCIDLVKVSGITRSKKYSKRIDQKLNVSLFCPDIIQCLQDSYAYLKECRKKLEYK